MMLQPLDNFFSQFDAETSSCLYFLRTYILRSDENITEAVKWGIPCFYYKGKFCCYLSVHKKFNQPYIAIVEGAKMTNPLLLKENRSRIKILLVNQHEDVPLDTIDSVMNEMLAIYKHILK